VGRLMEIQKNVVMQVIHKIRVEKQKVGLIEMIMQSMKKKNQSDEKIRDILRQKLFDMYENTTNEYLNDEDLFFNRILASSNRLLKILRAHSTSIDSLEKKMNKMTRT
jgi:hypothetical protein